MKNYLFLYFILFILKIVFINAHGDHSSPTKLLYMVFDSIKHDVFLKLQTESFGKFFRHFYHYQVSIVQDRNALFYSLTSGCDKIKNCEPVWYINQKNNHQSAILSWPGNLTFNETIWPSYSFYSFDKLKIPLELSLSRLNNWFENTHTTFSMVYIDNLSGTDNNDISSIIKFIDSNDDNNMVIVFIVDNKVIHLYTYGTRFQNASNDKTIKIKLTDICPMIVEVLDLEYMKHHEGNSSVISQIVKLSIKSYNSIFTYAFGLTIIVCGAIFTLILLVYAVQQVLSRQRRLRLLNRCQLRGMGVQMGTATSIPGGSALESAHQNIPEHDLLLDNSASEDELLDNNNYFSSHSRDPNRLNIQPADHRHLSDIDLS